jgi:hypothetical protein
MIICGALSYVRARQPPPILKIIFKHVQVARDALTPSLSLISICLPFTAPDSKQPVRYCFRLLKYESPMHISLQATSHHPERCSTTIEHSKFLCFA